MLTLHAFATPNSLKPVIALEELGLLYNLQRVDLRTGEQRGDEFLGMNPNAKVPVLVDGALVLGESAAILVHLAETSGQLLPTDQLLARHEHVAGSVYSIADIAHFGWLWRHQAIGVTFDRLPNVARWFTQVSARPAVQSAIATIVAIAA
jgi:GST-like protein